MPNGRLHGKKIEIPFYVQKIFNLRRKRRVTQAEMAESLGINFYQYRAIEIGTRPISIPEAQSAAAKLGVELWEFFSNSMQKEPFSQNERRLISEFRLLSDLQRNLILQLTCELNPNNKNQKEGQH